MNEDESPATESAATELISTDSNPIAVFNLIIVDLSIIVTFCTTYRELIQILNL